ncbi:MAG: hypothetical protein CM15mV8_0420 [Caudoviricetes sp.]|nr:MAG: hypothetical protein CM15mV8_0420 [Caudoviricetes sp.]
MRRIIYSFYIDIPENELDIFDKNILKENQVLLISILKNNLKKTIIS